METAGEPALAVTHVSPHGFTLCIGEDVLRLPYTRLPWFRRARWRSIQRVEWLAPGQLAWPELGVELSEAFIRACAARRRGSRIF